MITTWMNQSTLGDMKQNVEVKTPTSSIHHVIKTNIKLSLHKQSPTVLVTIKRTHAQYVNNASGMQCDAMSLTEFGADYLIENETL